MSLNSFSRFQSQDTITRSSVKQLLEERKAKIVNKEKKRKSKKEREGKSKGSPSSLKKKKQKKGGSKKGKKMKKRKKNSLILEEKREGMRESMRGVSSGSSVYAKDIESFCPFARYYSPHVFYLFKVTTLGFLTK